MSLCHKLWFSNYFIFRTKCCSIWKKWGNRFCSTTHIVKYSANRFYYLLLFTRKKINSRWYYTNQKCMNKYYPEWRDLWEPLIQGAGLQLTPSSPFHSTLVSDLTLVLSWAGRPAPQLRGTRNNGLSGVASVSRLGLFYI